MDGGISFRRGSEQGTADLRGDVPVQLLTGLGLDDGSARILADKLSDPVRVTRFRPPAEFVQRLKRNADSQPFGACVDTDYRRGSLDDAVLLDADGATIAVKPDGDIVAVSNLDKEAGGKKTAFRDAMYLAVAFGGNRMDVYGRDLVNKYAKYGFVPVARVDFNPDFCSSEKLEAFGKLRERGVRPDVYVLIHNGDSLAEVVRKFENKEYHEYSQEELDSELTHFGKDQYDEAIAHGVELLRERRGVGAEGADGVAGAEGVPGGKGVAQGAAVEDTGGAGGELGWEAVTPGGEVKVGGEWVVMDVDDIITSDMPSFPAALQPRNRETVGSWIQIQQIAGHLQPFRLFESTETDGGAPIITPLGEVLSGNGRVMALREAMRNGRADEYMELVRRRAEEMGIIIPAGIEHPVMLRRVDVMPEGTKIEWVAELSNRAKILSRSEAEAAEADAKTILEKGLLRLYAPDEDGNLHALSNAEFMAGFIREVGDASLMDSTGKPTIAAGLRVKRAMLALIIGTGEAAREDIRALVERAGTLRMSKTVDGVMRAAGDLASIAGKPGYDIAPDVGLALSNLLHMRASGATNVKGWLAQGTLFDPEILKTVEALMRAFGERASSAVATANLLSEYVARAKLIDTTTANLFPGNADAADTKKAELLRLAEEATRPERRTRYSITAEGAGPGAGAEAEAQYRAVEAMYRGTDRWMKAPNGEPTKLTELQWVQVRTPNFKRWFGDWENDPENASKVVDENGEPKVVYHGSRSGGGFHVFSGASFFTDDYDTADMFSMESEYSLFVNGEEELLDARKASDLAGEISGGDYTVDELLDRDYSLDDFLDSPEKIKKVNRALGMDFKPGDVFSFKRNDVMYKVFLNIRNPETADFGGRVWQAGDVMPETLFPKARENGRDGILVSNIVEGGPVAETRAGEEPPPSTDYIVFSPSQIKSADDNTGAFDPANPDIRYSVTADEAERLLAKKRPELSAEDRKARVGALFAAAPPDGVTKNKFRLTVLHWMTRGDTRLPEDMPAVVAALRVAENKHADPMAYDTPQALVNQFRDVSVAEGATLLDPDTVPEFTGKEDRGDGVAVYAVDDTQAGQKAVRDVLNNNYGKDFNCWCLVHGNKNGGLSTKAWDWWKHYNKTPKKIAFQDGRAVAFQADDTGAGLWWDLEDKSHYWLEDITEGRRWDEHGRIKKDYTGVVRKRHKDGSLKSEEPYRNGKLHGVSRQWYENGQKYIEATYKDDKRDGVSRQWYRNGQKASEEHYKDGKLNGLSQWWFDGGQKYREATCKDGKLHGVWRQWWKNGQLSIERHYRNDKRDGVQREWYENGQLECEWHCRNGQEDGVWRQWWKNGQLKLESQSKDGKRDGVQRSWYENGQLSSEHHYRNDKRDGVCREWYENGQKASEVHYKDGKRDGLSQWWFDSGQLRYEDHYRNDQEDGVQREWDKDGNLVLEEHWRNGQRVEEGEAADDERFSLEAGVEETDRMIAWHNISSSALGEAIELGGFAMPSWAVKRADSVHKDYGDISVIASKSSIAPRRDKTQMVFAGDAWTPVFPEVHYKINEKAADAVHDKVDGLLKQAGTSSADFLIALDADNIAHSLWRNGGSFVESYRGNDGMKLAFLKDTGHKIAIPMQEKVYSNYANIAALKEVIRQFPDFKTMGSKEELEAEPKLRGIIHEAAIKKYGQALGNKLYPADKPLGFNKVDHIFHAARQYARSGDTRAVDMQKLSEKIDILMTGEKINDEYETWLANLGKGIIAKKGIRNNTDLFTPSGNRRGFDALHYDYNLANIVRAMQKQPKQGKTQAFSGAGSVKGAALKSFGSIEEVRAELGRLVPESDEKSKAAYDKFSDDTLKLANKVADDPFTGSDILAEVLSAAKTVEAIERYLNKEYRFLATEKGLDLSALAQEIYDLGQEANTLPMEYFEAKTYRAFPLQEAAGIVVPDDLDKKLVDELQRKGANVLTYESGNESDRLEKVNSIPDVRFSITSTRPWPADFPKATIHTKLGYVRAKYGDLHARAKAGDKPAAEELVKAVVDRDKRKRLRAMAKRHPGAIVAYPHAEESTGRNTIPGTLANALVKESRALVEEGEIKEGLKLDDSIVQTVRAGHTGAKQIGPIL